MKIYAAQYCECKYESDPGVILLHKSKRNALYACVKHRHELILLYMDLYEYSYHDAKKEVKEDEISAYYCVKEYEILD